MQNYCGAIKDCPWSDCLEMQGNKLFSLNHKSIAKRYLDCECTHSAKVNKSKLELKVMGEITPRVNGDVHLTPVVAFISINSSS